tara:strand:+ start:1321 stop:2094 length:774 start_codon:yes stop_codon:yes gene_type:complete
MNNIIFIFSHYDDEFGLFNVIEKSTKKNKNVFVLYLTSGLTIQETKNKKKLQRREYESLKILLKLGVKKKNIIFLGKKLNIKVYGLYKKLNITYKFINKFLKKLKGNYILYTHAWEGGNEDHDASFVIVKKILCKNIRAILGFQFSQYHRKNAYIYPFKVQTLINSNSKIYKSRLNFFSKIKFISYLFTYTSQLYIWLPIYPFIILRILFNNYGNVKIISKNLIIKKPHSGNLLYENLRVNKYKQLKKYFFNFLEKS